ncbi:hypothetical protein AKJ18_23670, partial [Vibrio xuii]
SGIIGAVFSTSIALDKGQEVTKEIVQTVYGEYFQLLTILAIVMVVISILASLLIKKMLASAKAGQGPELATAQS